MVAPAQQHPTRFRPLMPTVNDLRACGELCVSLLSRITPEDWTTAVPTMGNDVAHVCAHISQANYWYSIDLSARGVDLDSVVPEVNAESETASLIASVQVGVELLAAVVAAAPADARGFHPFGQADAAGFAAMACDEMLIHTWDIAQVLSLDFVPPDSLAKRVLERLFPWVEGDHDAWELLRWSNGRIELGGRPRLGKWKWHCAPLVEWDGSAGTAP